VLSTLLGKDTHELLERLEGLAQLEVELEVCNTFEICSVRREQPGKINSPVIRGA
jgi:hypothetical protein